MSEEEHKQMVELLTMIAYQEVRQAIKAGLIEEEKLGDLSFIKGVVFGIAVTQRRYKQMEEIEDIGKELAEEILKKVKKEHGKN